MESINEVYEFYNNGAEVDRLERGLGIITFISHWIIIMRPFIFCLPALCAWRALFL